MKSYAEQVAETKAAQAKAPSTAPTASTIPTSAPMLAALNRSGKPIYAGTVPAVTVARRRKANRAARAQRRTDRHR